MKYKLQAPFQTGSAAGCPVVEGIVFVDTKEQVADLCQPPNNFRYLGEVDELAKLEEETAENEGLAAEPAAEESVQENENSKKGKKGK